MPGESTTTRSEPTKMMPMVRELPADLDTPVSVFLKLASQGPSFLLESVSGGEQLARYSFIGLEPRRAYVLRGGSITLHEGGESRELPVAPGSDPLDMLRDEMEGYRLSPKEGLPRFVGGLVGYLGYDTVQAFETSVPAGRHPVWPEGIFLLSDTLVAFDHAYGRVLLIANTHVNGDPYVARRTAAARLDDLEGRLRRPLTSPSPDPRGQDTGQFRANMSRKEYTRAVLKAQEHIRAGDIFQVVLSQRLSRESSAAPFDIYRALRRLNPSPYMFYFDFGTLGGDRPLRLIGASPEMHVRLEGKRASVRPIAGTRERGGSPAEDERLEGELLADPKERAEHVMLVDLARNDLGRVCRFGTVQVREQMTVERYSHVMHIVSHVEGELEPDQDAFSLMRATFPAGTVSGAPKIRAMQIIHELEDEPRGPYAGAVGYFSFDGSMDTCITIRTLSMEGNQISVQAGAGIVADSDPDREYEETLNKARALGKAVGMAEGRES